MNCTNCGAPLFGNEQNCPNCGMYLVPPIFCNNCGTQIPHGHPVCVRCGAPAGRQPMNPYAEAEAGKLASSALTFGILGVAFAMTFFLSFLGIIFSSVALSKAKKYKEMTGTFLGKAGVGKGLGIGGLIAGIVYTVAFGFWLIIMVGVGFMA